MAPFQTVLVANRGEIARRIIRTLQRLGIRSVAVYSDADVDAPHVREADVAVRIGSAAAAASYLNADAVIAAAIASGAQAIHPGYGFLSENAAFARACADAGIVFVGPGVDALEVMGDKIRAKEHVIARGVPTVPGFSAIGLSDAEIARRANEVGYPVLVKPSAGGGGKGMQIVRDPGELAAALETARRVAASAFGDDTLLLERLIDRPRHIEVQVLADAHGAVIHLGERECTLQRRHQKVIEEAPSPIVDEALRARLGAAACAAAESVAYRGAGTVEFLVSAERPDEFFFIEMNTRLQVEHPVTELVTGMDLVAAQLRIAAGESLGIIQGDVQLTGHAIEARVYAESPERGFLPATGEALLWGAAEGVRTDAGIETGSHITADYDPMIAKVIAYGADRADALHRLDAALADTVLLGVDSNIGFLRSLLADGAVRAGDLDTGLIDRRAQPVAELPPPAAVAAAAGAVPLTVTGAASALWRTGWGEPAEQMRSFDTDAGAVSTARSSTSEDVPTRVDADGDVWVHADGRAWRLHPISRRAALTRRLASLERGADATSPELVSPMPGTVVAVHVTDGQVVASGDRIVTVEAMKMEHSVTAPHDGVVRVHVTAGAQVRRDELLAEVTSNVTSNVTGDVTNNVTGDVAESTTESPMEDPDVP